MSVLSRTRWLLVVLFGWLTVLASAAAAPAMTTHPSQIALPDHQALRFDRFTLDQGLSNNFITSILQDQQGFIWVGTEDGLNRFDGYTFRTYRSDPTNPHTLPNNVVLALAEDQHRMLWIGTEAGLVRFDPAQERFTTYPHDPTGTAGLLAEDITDMWEDCQGQLWIGTSRGLSRLNRHTQTYTAYTTHHGLPNATINGILSDAQCNLWVSTNYGLSRFDPDTETFRPG
jgi:ligand-binding sensor domain-containing protein